MKKSGFTLSEMLVALGIVGVIAAMTIPMIHKVTPDKDKTMVLKAYKTISGINYKILNDQSLYMLGTGKYGSTTEACTAIMECTDAPSDPKYAGNSPLGQPYSGLYKYIQLFAENLNLSEIGLAQSEHLTVPILGVQAADGTYWLIMYDITGSSGFKHFIYVANQVIDVSTDCPYDKNTCPNPKVYKFDIDKYGQVSAGDNLTKIYLQSPTVLNDRSGDLKRASQL